MRMETIDIHQIITYSYTLDLNANSPVALQPSRLNVQLKPHQLTLLHKCLEIENGSVPLLSNIQNATMRTRIGIIGDKVGSGKSYVIIGLILSENTFRGVEGNQRTIFSSLAHDNIIISFQDNTQYTQTDVLVIPHNLVKQWSTYLSTSVPDLKVAYATSNRQLVSLQASDIHENNLIVVSSTFYNKFTYMVRERGYTFRRLIIDEADTISIPSCENITCQFIWFVTASYQNLIYPKGKHTWDRDLHRDVIVAQGVKSSGFIRSLFQSMSAMLTALIVIKNSEEFIQESMQLPTVIKHYVQCRTSRTIAILNGIADRNLISALNANDIATAIRYINPTNRNTEEHIINMLLEKFNRLMQNSKRMLDVVMNDILFESPTLRDVEITKHKKIVAEYEQKIRDITERIKTTDTCCICYDTIKDKTVLNCCNNAFCFVCITKWFGARHQCPLCKSVLTKENLFVIQDSPCMSVSTSNSLSDTLDKFENLSTMIRARQSGSKFLICSVYDNTFERVQEFLGVENIKFAHLRGSHDVVASIVQRYKCNDLDVLFINPKNYGSGLNLENTTDIVIMHQIDNETEKQVIGRAQRLGRSHPLNVWYLLHQNEMISA
jgi:SNF2 family DNA or RNA helicase